MKKTLQLLALTALPISALAANGVYWPQEKAAIPAILNHGYHDIQITSIQPWHCPDGTYDPNRVIFRAISPDDHIVTGSLCNGEVYLRRQSETEIGAKKSV